jgi:hypothetical protein
VGLQTAILDNAKSPTDDATTRRKNEIQAALGERAPPNALTQESKWLNAPAGGK